ncbi:MAG: RidA family protein [Candidatus Rokubacteria bacterium]|nr:RidA family protein [Candidatus Rokubacteria bacterium]
MAKDPVSVPALPKPIGPFNYAVRSKGMLYVSGAIGVDENWKVVAPDDVTAQSKKALEWIKATLDATKVPLANVVKMTVYLTDAADYKAFNEVRRGFFPEPYPASTVVVVKELVLKGAVVEVEVVAELP